METGDKFLFTYLPVLAYNHALFSFTAAAFTSSCLDYCNSLLYGINDGLLKKLQAVQNAAALSRQRPGSSTTLRQSCANFTASGSQAHRLQASGDGLQ